MRRRRRGRDCWNGEGGEGDFKSGSVWGKEFCLFCLFWIWEHKNGGFRRYLFINIENAS